MDFNPAINSFDRFRCFSTEADNSKELSAFFVFPHGRSGVGGLSEGPKGRAERIAACEIGKERQRAFSWLTAVLAVAGMGLIREPGAEMIPLVTREKIKKNHKQRGFYFNKQEARAAFEFRFIIRRLLFREILLCGSNFRRCKKGEMLLFFSC